MLFQIYCDAPPLIPWLNPLRRSELMTDFVVTKYTRILYQRLLTDSTIHNSLPEIYWKRFNVKEFHLLADYYDPLTNSLNFPIYPFDRMFCNELEKLTDVRITSTKYQGMKPKGPYTISADTFKSLSGLKTFMVDVDIVFVVNFEDIQKLLKVSNYELIELE
ncbi:hypothetical protein WR25_26150 [Diploscapter pachys]|uniref:Uncharacterized protein n=1 Tax=Diploscapter pachys TaxID=2018661 RepID=A0A2A2J609_9BILA|nr:hypothetical protein WR25_26150 [Diploscapter pachys]